jgi:hypothetical protein
MKTLHLAAISLLLAGLYALLAACAGMKATPNGYSSHAEYIAAGQQITCGECHENEQKGTMKPTLTFNHTRVFIKNHGSYASQDDRLCTSCHKVSFCADCHTNSTEIKPSSKYGYRPDREMPHRGNYMTIHKIEGKLDPASCYRCHGRSNNERCNSCHR